VNNYNAETFPDLYACLPLPGQIRQLGTMLRILKRNVEEAAHRPLSEIAESVEAIDEERLNEFNAEIFRAKLKEHALRQLLGVHPALAVPSAVLSRQEILQILPSLAFSPAIQPEQIGRDSIDLTVGVPEGLKAGDEIVFKKGDPVKVLSALERHGPWPRYLIGHVAERSHYAQKGLYHLTSPWIFPDSVGEIRLEFRYEGREDGKPLVVKVGVDRLVHLTLFRLGAGKLNSNGDINGRNNENGKHSNNGNGHREADADTIRELAPYQYKA
jgi:hypothetical protein